MSETDEGVQIHYKIEHEHSVPQVDKMHIP